jgi:hypothetical protein
VYGFYSAKFLHADDLVDDVYSKIEFSPVWLQWAGDADYSVALKTHEIPMNQGGTGTK